MIDISKVSDSNFDEFALNVFRFQFSSNPIYHEFCSRIGVSAEAVNQVQDIPFLPISFFKSHKIISIDLSSILGISIKQSPCITLFISGSGYRKSVR